jgi:hypothetical protein
MNYDMLPIFIGYDAREDIAYKVCEYSIYKHTPEAEVKPLKQDALRRDGMYTRPADPLSTTEFTFTRFLVPAIMNYNGWALFCDCDFVWTDDIRELFNQVNDNYAVMVVKHEHKPTNTVKMDGAQQTQYPRKNWSSMIMWNCGHPSNAGLTPEKVNSESGQYLHRFEWLKDDEIGELNIKYNFLVGWNNEKQHGKPVAYHWTEGGPWFEKYHDCEYKDVWYKYLMEFAQELALNNNQSHTAITWVTSLSRAYYDEIANLTMSTWGDLPGDLVIVWDDKPVDLGFGKIASFWKDVVSEADPWMNEGMGGTKADRFWKKSRVQIWAARRFKGLVIWIDADIMVTKRITKSKAIEMLHPRENVWGTLNCGDDFLGKDFIDTGLVGFNTRHENFEEFIRDYSLVWYDGRIYQLPQPYDHYAVTSMRHKWKMKSYVPHFNTWPSIPSDIINRFAMENSYVKEYFTHYLGIDKKNLLNEQAGNTDKVKKKKEK